MSAPPRRQGRGTQIGRGAKVRAAVLAATLAELADNGYAALTIDNVARRCGVHKTTVYRRWADRDSLIADAVTDLVATDMPVAAGQDIDTDLRTFARSLVGFWTSPVGRAVLALLTPDAAADPRFARLRHRFFTDRFHRAEPMVSAAIARGQLPAGTDTAELIKTVIAPIYLRLLVTIEPIGADTADTAARVALVAARAGLLGAPGRTGGTGVRTPAIR